jgi:hypothetical protein
VAKKLVRSVTGRWERKFDNKSESKKQTNKTFHFVTRISNVLKKEGAFHNPYLFHVSGARPIVGIRQIKTPFSRKIIKHEYFSITC